MTPIRTERLILRNWEDRDRELFYRINSDDASWNTFHFAATALPRTPKWTSSAPGSPRMATVSLPPR